MASSCTFAGCFNSCSLSPLEQPSSLQKQASCVGRLGNVPSQTSSSRGCNFLAVPLTSRGTVAPSCSRQTSGKYRIRHRWRAGSANDDVSGGLADPEETLQRIEQLRAQLDHAVKAEDYTRAAQLRDRLQLLLEDNNTAVLSANRQFYRAFATGDTGLMSRLWAKGDHVQCLHPGSYCIAGYDMVMASWDAVLGGMGSSDIELEDLRVHTGSDLAFVTCIEIIGSPGRKGRVVATNVFEKEDGEWRICLHHGAQAPMGAMFG
eukprot:TRINITY_DN10941_c0_g1_i1.p1 TRINITY_DN10941_c0_g1~~TRINITY_DN10941_c0_g1_i1.p1  ORF type:complete len:305 (-),score=16.62 TRINITY_DN10941_c0_g1_i1:1407-2192(-)